MTSRGVLILAALLIAIAAVGVWKWSEGNRPANAAPTNSAPDTSTSSAHHAESAGSAKALADAAATNSPRPTVRPDLTSAVVPGAPVVRTTSIPSNSSEVADAKAGVAQPAKSPPETALEGKTDLEGVRSMLLNFRTRMGENPVGSNAEIMRAVMGGNSVGANLGPPEGQNLNEAGELVDRWGTPYFFHQLSKNSMEIRSAGPDHQMWTADDLVTK